MPSWDERRKTATRSDSEGGDFPQIDDDIYEAIIADVSEPEYKESQYGGQEQFFLKWEFDNQDDERVWLRQYLTLPKGLIDNGKLHIKAKLYKVMESLGFNMMGAEIDVDPPSWQGLEARIVVKNVAPASGGDVRPRITDVMPLKKKAAAGAKASAKKGGDDSDLPFE